MAIPGEVAARNWSTQPTSTLEGLRDDRLLHVRDDRGLVTGRTLGRLLPLRTTTGAAGPLVQGHAGNSPETAAMVQAAAGPGARLVPDGGPQRTRSDVRWSPPTQKSPGSDLS